MHTMSMHARQVTRWRWVATAIVIILLQAAAAVLVRSSLVRGSRAPETAQHGRGNAPAVRSP